MSSTPREATPASVSAIARGDSLDVSNLPSYGFGTRSLMWWGTVGMCAIEGTAFAFMIVIYFYLRGLSPEWPAGRPAPDLLWGTVNLGVILASAIPNYYCDRAAIAQDLARVKFMLLLGVLCGIVLCGVRWLEFTALNVRWSDGAYGSVVWMLMGLHTFNLVTDVIDTMVLAAVMYKTPLEGKRYVDVAENSGYWVFIVVTWVPIYAVVYWGARF